ncbi:MAG TPA: DinB family protein [Gemmatimonadales bacterium]|nr:DinB family protein [Gemmatimonadales bacterium]
MHASDLAESVDRIRDQFQRAWDGDAWHGPTLTELLESISSEMSRWRPPAGAHSIQELTSHITFWLDAAHRRLNGETYLPTSGDWDVPTAEDWDGTVARLRDTYRSLVDAIAATPASRLRDPVAGKPYDVYVLLHGVLQHTLYHAGQIAMMRRLAGG